MVVRKPNITHVTVVGRVFVDDEGYQRLSYTAWKYKTALTKAIQLLSKGLSNDYTEKIITKGA